MKQRYRVFRRGWGTYYCEDLVTRKQESLKTRDKDEAYLLVAAKTKPTKPPPSASIWRGCIGRRAIRPEPRERGRM